MLFSNREVAEFLNATFEPTWESVRPAPLVTVDFGNGHVVTRTFQGNVATYVTDADGRVFDVLPGIYTPEPYRDGLTKLADLAGSLRRLPDGEASAKLAKYHAALAAPAAFPVPANVRAVAVGGGGIKGGIGGFPGGFGGQIGGPLVAVNPTGIEGPLQALIAGQPLAANSGLALDVTANETVRRRQIHERLAKSGPVTPDDLKRWLFKEVLHADLDDPLLGLGPVLNANYPFATEDRAAAGR